MSDYDDVDLEVLDLGLGELLRRARAQWPDRVAAVFPGERITYGELWSGALEVGERLVRAGITPGEHVGLLLPNSTRFLTSLFGISLCGAIPVPINTRYRTAELPYALEHPDLVALITTCEVAVNANGDAVDYPARLAEALPTIRAQVGDPLQTVRCHEAPRLRFVAGYGPVRHDWIAPWPDAGETDVAGSDPSPAWIRHSDPHSTALILYTSGTTSRPKGVQNSHDALVRMGVLGMIGRLKMTSDDVVWSPAPMCHIGSFVALIGAIAIGARFVSAPYFEVNATIDLLEAEGVTMAYAGFPAFYFDIAERLRQTGRTLPALEILTTAAAPGHIERVREGFPGALQISVTGSTELSGTICANDRTDSPEQRATTAGRPLEGIELSIRNSDGHEVPAGVSGELWVRGYCLLLGYYKDPNPLLTPAPDPGWFRTGDLGVLLDGRFAFRGRLKDMIKVGGENVAAAEVENYLLGNRAIALAQVVPGPDERLGEVPVAFIELAPGASLTEEGVVAFCRGGMAAYKVPRAVHFVTSWPMSASKISKQALRELAAS